MFQFLHPRPVVDRRPVAEHSVQVRAVTLPVLTALPAPPTDRLTDPLDPAAAPPVLSPPAAPSARGPASDR